MNATFTHSDSSYTIGDSDFMYRTFQLVVMYLLLKGTVYMIGRTEYILLDVAKKHFLIYCEIACILRPAE